MPELSGLAKAPERAAKNSDIVFMKAQYEKIIKEYDKLLERLW